MAFPVKPEAALASCLRNILQDMHPILNSKDLVSFWGIDGELKNLQKILKRIQDVLNDAEWRSQTEVSVSDWMEDLRELLYCIEDFVDDMNIERVRMEKHLAALKHQSQGHQATNERTILDIQGHYTSEKAKTSKSIKKFLGELDEVDKDAKKLKLRSQTLVGTPVARFVVRDGEDIGPLVDESEIYGRQEDKDRVTELLLSPNDSSKNYSVVSIVGMGGVGKTTLARLVFQDERIKSHFEMQSWACVSDDFDFNRVVRELIEYATKINTSKMTTAALLDRLDGMVAGKRVLFVLDDIWTVEAWEKLKVVFTRCVKKSKILVTTRDKNIGNAINNKEIYELQTLEDKHCLVLFKEKAFCGVVDERLERIGTKIVERCKGVPLAVKAIGSSLRLALKEIWESILENDIWRSMDVAKNGIFPVLKLSYYYLPSSLKRCFQYLSVFPTDYWFERDILVRQWIAEGLIESKEGGTLEDIGCSYYVELQRRCLIQEDNKMHDLLHSLACLVSGKFFSRSAKGSKSYMHMGSIRHLSLIDEEAKIEMFDEVRCLRTLLVVGNSLFDEINLKWTHLRVFYISGNDLSELPSSVGNLKHLRYLNLSGCSNLQSLPDSICELHNLQTLDLSACRGIWGSALPTEVGNLQNLRYLCLREMKYLSALPSSIVKLSNLLTLNLQGCRSLSHLPNEIGHLQDLRELWLSGSSISCLPNSICNIRNLRILDIYDCRMLKLLPRNVGNLICIEQLGRFFVGREEGHGIEELKDMNKLQGKLIIFNLENVHGVEDALMANLKKKVLNEIHFSWRSAFLLNKGHDSINVLEDDDISDVDRDLEARMLDALEPHPTSLEALSFRNYRGGRIPKWMSPLSFPILKELTFSGCTGLREALLLFPNLKDLDVQECPKLIFNPEDLRYLTSLESITFSCQLEAGKEVSLQNLFRLEDMTIRGFAGQVLPLAGDDEAGSASSSLPPKLKILAIQHCPNLTLLPKALHACASLRTLIISDCPKLVSFPRTGLPPLLLILEVSSCGNLQYLPTGLNDHTSLRRISFEDCEQVQARPEDRPPPNFRYMGVSKCSKLEQQIKQHRKDWLAKTHFL